MKEKNTVGNFKRIGHKPRRNKKLEWKITNRKECLRMIKRLFEKVLLFCNLTLFGILVLLIVTSFNPNEDLLLLTMTIVTSFNIGMGVFKICRKIKRKSR